MNVLYPIAINIDNNHVLLLLLVTRTRNIVYCTDELGIYCRKDADNFPNFAMTFPCFQDRLQRLFSVSHLLPKI